MLMPRFPDKVKELYRSSVDSYNKYVSYTQDYFAGKPMQNEEQYDWYSVLYDLNIPTKGDNKELLSYMRRYDLSWDDLNFKKTYSKFGNGRTEAFFGALNFVSDNVKRLY